MSKRAQETQGGEDRYGFVNGGPGDVADKPQQANAAQMARRKIASVKKSTASARSSRANTPTANPFAPQQQSFPAFQPPQQEGGGGSFNFNVNAPSNPFQNANGASGTPPPFQMSQASQQQNGGSIFGNTAASFGSTIGSNTPAQPQQNGFSFGQGNNANGNSTPTFGNFGQKKETASQHNGVTPASNTPSFSFGQANGTPSSELQFGQPQQQTQSTAGTSFGSFGKTPQANTDKPTTLFGGFVIGTQQQASDKAAAPSFGQSLQQNGDKSGTPKFSFGSTQPQANGEKASLFGPTPPAEQTSKSHTGSLFSFNSQSHGFGTKPTPDASTKFSETPKAPLSNLFGGSQSTGKGLFGSTPPPGESSGTPKPGDSIFSTQNKPKLGGNLFTADMAEGKRPESPAAGFGQQSQQNGQSAPDADATPKANNVFGGFGKPQANAVENTLKPSNNVFGTSTSGEASSQQSAAAKNFFNQSTQDTTMHTPGSIPQKSSLFTPAASQQAAPAFQQQAVSETSAPGRSLFDRISKPAEVPATLQKGSEKSLLEQPATSSRPNPSGSLFRNQSGTTAPSTAQAAPDFITERSTSDSRASAQKSSSSLSDVIPEDEKETLKVLNEGLAAHLAKQDTTVDWTTIMEYYLKQAAIIRHKPARNLDALSAGPSTASTPAPRVGQPTAPPVHAAAEAAPVKKPTPFNRAQAAASRAATTSDSASDNVSGSSTSAPPKPATSFQKNNSSNLQQTPKPSFLQPPSTAPANRKRSAEDEPERPPASEKRARANESTVYPKLPDNASDAARNFLSHLEQPRSTSTGLSGQSQRMQEQQLPRGNETDTDQTQSSSPPPTAFKPSASGFTPSNSGFKASASGFTPSMASAGNNNFLASFGKRANAQEEEDRMKRKDEDYDSEEESYEDWAKRDRKEQEAKRAKVLEEAKAASGFVVKSTVKSTEQDARKHGNDGAELGRDREESNKNDERDKPPESGQGKSLFDRISKPASSTTGSPSLFSAQTPASKTPTSSLFGSSATPAKSGGSSNPFGNLFKPVSDEASQASDREEKGGSGEKQTQGTGDSTWKPSTPIKFGATAGTENASTTPAAPPPSFSNLFGTKTQDSTSNSASHLNVPSAKPNMGFFFGAQPSSMCGSRATTPGVTTDGEGTGASTAGEGDNEPNDDTPASEAQVEDMTGLSAEETKTETLLFSVAMSKGSKWDEKKDDEGGMAHGWADRGKGPLYLLKNNESGKMRILLKVPPYGAAKMNFPPLKGGGYEVQGKTGKQITGTFYDHMADKPGLGKWLIQVGKKEDAEEVARILRKETEEK